MSAFSYYSPFLLGVAFCALVIASGFEELVGTQRIVAYAVACPLVGLLFQFKMVGVQGLMAQVLPVPVGKSIRGRGAVVTGVLLLAAVLCVDGAILLGVEGMTRVVTVLAMAGGAFAVAAFGAYAWSLPAAVRDFSRT